MFRVAPLDPVASSFLLHFPDEKSLYSVDWIGLLARKKKVQQNLNSTLILLRRKSKGCPNSLGRLVFKGLIAREHTADVSVFTRFLASLSDTLILLHVRESLDNPSKNVFDAL